MGLFTPVWKSTDAQKAIDAVKKETNQLKLAEIAQNAPIDKVRKTAVEKLTDQSVLLRVALNDPYEYSRTSAVKNLTDQNFLKIIAVKDPKEYVRGEAIRKITDTAFLRELAMSNGRDKLTAAFVLKDQAVLIHIARTDNDHRNRSVATSGITDQSVILDIIKNEKDWQTQVDMISYLTDASILTGIADNSEKYSETLSRAAAGKLAEIKRNAQNDCSHSWRLIPNKCERVCSVCGKSERVDHKLERIDGTCIGKCTNCGAEFEAFHDWDGCVCKRCSQTNQNAKEGHIRGNNCRCVRCGADMHNWIYAYKADNGAYSRTCSICGANDHWGPHSDH